MTKLTAIPRAVLEVLTHPWRTPEPGYSNFESQWSDDEPYQSECRRDPSFYYAHTDHDYEVNGITDREAYALHDAGVFGTVSERRESGTVVINEHAVHALNDFFEETYTAWRKYEVRLAEIEKAQLPFHILKRRA